MEKNSDGTGLSAGAAKLENNLLKRRAEPNEFDAMGDLTSLSAYRFLIIGGTSKAATTSIFNYLAKHPQICPSIKETRFFLDPDYPLPSEQRYRGNNPEAYLSFFGSEEGFSRDKWRLEATPDYLYSENTPHSVRQTLTNVRFIFILREPVSRLLSWYRFGQAMNEIPVRMTFDDYVAVQREIGGRFCDGYRHPAFAALQHGRYSMYLKRFIEVFGASSVHVVFYEELQRDPLSFMISICRLMDIDDTYFRGYSFGIVNKGMQVRSPRFHRVYVDAAQKLRDWVRHTPKVRRLLRQMGGKMDAAYEKFNVVPSRKVMMSEFTRDFVSGYYKEESAHLQELLGISVPWRDGNTVAASLS